MAFDLSRILAYQIATERTNDGINRLRIGPTRRLTETDMPLVSGDANKVRAAQQSDSTSAIFMRLPFPRCWLRQPSAVQARLYTGSMPPRDVHPARTAVADSRGRCPSPKGSAVRTGNRRCRQRASRWLPLRPVNLRPSVDGDPPLELTTPAAACRDVWAFESRGRPYRLQRRFPDTGPRCFHRSGRPWSDHG